jgi:protein subunit release factor A
MRLSVGVRSARATASERIRTYNFPQNRADRPPHRASRSTDLPQVMEGEIDAIIGGAAEG